MGSPFVANRAKAERPTEYPYESLYRPWGCSCGSLLIFAVLVGILYVLYRRRQARSRRSTVSYRRVEVNSEAAERDGDAVTVLVTGGNGVLGSSLIKCLLKAGGYRVHSLDLWIPEKGKRNPEICSYIQADITNLNDMVMALQGIETVFHTAALIPNVKCSDADYYRVNTQGTGTVVEACKRCGVKRLVYTSTIAVVVSNDPKQDLDGVDETLPYPRTPLNAYTGAKAAAEKLVLQANGENGFVTCAMRPGGLLGHTSPFFQRMGKAYIGDGLQVFNFLLVPVDAVARAHVLAEQKLRQGQSSVAAGKAYNLCIDDRLVYREYQGYEPNAPVSIWGLPPPYSIPYWVAAVFAYLNRWIYVCTGKSPFMTTAAPINLTLLVHSKQVFSSARAHKELGWEELPPWREIVKALVKEAKTNTKKDQ